MSESEKISNKILMKKSRKTITLANKLDIIKRYETGDRKTKISRDLGLAESTVNTILRNVERIKKHANKSATMRTRIITKQRSDIIEEMEQILYEWIVNEQIQNQALPSSGSIKMKAICIHDELKEKKSIESSFLASNGWLHRFKKRAGLSTLAFGKNEKNSNIEKIQIKSENFIEKLKSTVTEGKYSWEQIFYLNETMLYWKSIPEGIDSLEFKEEQSTNSEMNKDYISLLFGGNITGSYKLKPLIVYHIENPLALKGINKETLPVIWRSSNNSKLNQHIFESWFYNHFISETYLYCLKNNIEFKILLILNETPYYPKYLGDFHANVKVSFVPFNFIPSFQINNEQIITVLKLFYLNYIFSQATNSINIEDSAKSFKDFWKFYNIYEAIKNVTKSWEDIEENKINLVWKQLFPDFNETTEESILGTYVEDNMKILKDTAEKLNIKLNNHAIEKWLKDHEDIEQKENDGMREEIIEQSTRVFSIEGLEDAFKQINAGLKKLEEMDPNTGRIFKINRIIENTLSCYKDIYDDKKKMAENFINEPEIQIEEFSEKFPSSSSFEFDCNYTSN